MVWLVNQIRPIGTKDRLHEFIRSLPSLNNRRDHILGEYKGLPKC